MRVKHCPDCRKTLLQQAKRCACGWQNGEQNDNDHYRCAFKLEGRRCPSVGTMCSSVRTTKWYCSLHWHATGDPQQSKEALKYVEENVHEVLEERRDWRLDLFEK